MKTLIVTTLLALAVAACSSTIEPGERIQLAGYVHAGPTCPTMQEPPDPNCADRPVAGAALVIVDADGNEVTRTVTDADGKFTAELPAGTYTLVPQPVEGLMGTAPPQEFSVPDTSGLDVAYDTGIR